MWFLFAAKTSHMEKTIITLILIILVSCTLISCSTKVSNEPDISGIPAKFEQTAVDPDEKEVLETALRVLEKGLFTVAKEQLLDFQKEYPVSIYSEFVSLKIADCFFKLSQYDEASLHYQSFRKDHPVSIWGDYSLIKLARSAHLSHPGPGRDLAPLRNAARYYKQFLKLYPQSIYADIARKGTVEVEIAEAKHELLIIAYYKKRGPESAYLTRTADFEKKWAPLIEAGEVSLKSDIEDD